MKYLVTDIRIDDFEMLINDTMMKFNNPLVYKILRPLVIYNKVITFNFELLEDGEHHIIHSTSSQPTNPELYHSINDIEGYFSKYKIEVHHPKDFVVESNCADDIVEQVVEYLPMSFTIK